MLVPSIKMRPIIAALIFSFPIMAYAQAPTPPEVPKPSAEPMPKPAPMLPKPPSLPESPAAATVDAQTPVPPPTSPAELPEPTVSGEDEAAKADYPVCSKGVTDQCVQRSQATKRPMKKQSGRNP